MHFLLVGTTAVMAGIDKETDDCVEGVKSRVGRGVMHGVAHAYGGARDHGYFLFMHGGAHYARQFLLGGVFSDKVLLHDAREDHEDDVRLWFVFNPKILNPKVCSARSKSL
jgi:hypothetical protein